LPHDGPDRRPSGHRIRWKVKVGKWTWIEPADRFRYGDSWDSDFVALQRRPDLSSAPRDGKPEFQKMLDKLCKKALRIIQQLSGTPPAALYSI